VPASRGGEAGAAAEDCACNRHYLNFQISAYGSTMTERYAFKMFLNPGCDAEYRRRHDAIWLELVWVLTEAGVDNYSIHLDQETSILFAIWSAARPPDGSTARPSGDAPLVGSHDGNHAHPSRRLAGRDPAH
jgi:L-rhamnose mutarotase